MKFEYFKQRVLELIDQSRTDEEIISILCLEEYSEKKRLEQETSIFKRTGDINEIKNYS